MIFHHVAHLMPDHEKKFLIGHDVHQAAEYSYRPIGHGKGIDISGEIHLEIEGVSIPFRIPGRKSAKACIVGIAGGCHLVLAVCSLRGMPCQLFHVFIGEGNGGSGIGCRIRHHQNIGIFAGDQKKRKEYK
ncbi:MAG: hypothetical protein ACD_75C01015G0001 [uncultured bacterium]|nr:MAG: hypothetical protein ACD_75C01015G0001 [uncultured bacterium]